MSREKQIDIITDLLIDFDEMGFAPTTPCPDSEAYAIDWKNELTKALEDYFKQSENVIELPCKVGDTVYCIERKNIHECLVTMVKSLTYEGATRFFVETECEIVSPFYSDGRKIKHGIMAVWEIEWGSWYRAFRTREEAEEALAKMKGGAE